MKKDVTNYEDADLRDLEQIAPWVHEGFARIEGPSARVMEAIHREAVLHAQRRPVRIRFSFYLRLASVAAIVLLLSGIFFNAWRSRSQEQYQQVVQLLNLTTKNPISENIGQTDPAELANLLLTMQGLDRESYFNASDGTEALWL
jgi:hypothetical protein